jgi:hypothetical protein
VVCSDLNCFFACLRERGLFAHSLLSCDFCGILGDCASILMGLLCHQMLASDQRCFVQLGTSERRPATRSTSAAFAEGKENAALAPDLEVRRVKNVDESGIHVLANLLSCPQI